MHMFNRLAGMNNPSWLLTGLLLVSGLLWLPEVPGGAPARTSLAAETGQPRDTEDELFDFFTQGDEELFDLIDKAIESRSKRSPSGNESEPMWEEFVMKVDMSPYLPDVKRSSKPIDTPRVTSTEKAKEYFEQGSAHGRQKKWARAEEAYGKAVELEPRNAEYRFRLGRSRNSQRKWSDSEPALRKAIELDSQHAHAHYYLEIALAELGNLTESEAMFREAVWLRPADAGFRRECARLLCFDLKKYDEGVAEYEEAIRLDPDNAKYRYELGRTWQWQKKWPQAEEALRKAIELDPNEADWHNKLSVVLYTQRKYREAEACFREAIRLEPGKRLYLVNLAGSLQDALKELGGQGPTATGWSHGAITPD